MHPVLIYPAQEKFRLSYETPYLECMARFQMALRHSDIALIVVGFGFKDAHIAAPIAAALQSNVGLRMLVVAPDLESTSNTTLKLVQELIARGDRRLAMVGATFDDIASFIPDLAPEYEQEVHQQRVEAATSVVEG